MNTTSRQLEAVKEAHANAVKAADAWNEYLSMSTDGSASEAAYDALATFLRAAEAAERVLTAKIEERRRAFDSAPILQAVIRWNGLERKIVVVKPNARIDEPFIPDTFYQAIRKNWDMPTGDVLVTAEAYDIVVIDRFNRRVATICSK